MPFLTLLAPLAAIFSPVLKNLWNPIVTQLGYPVKVTRNVEALRDAMQHLMLKRDDVRERISREERQLRRPTHQVEGWLREVEEIEDQVNKIAADYDQRSCLCLRSGSLDCWSNHQISKRASAKLEQVTALDGRGSFIEVTVELPPPPVQVMPATSTVLGLDSNVQEALHFLQEEDDSASDDEAGKLGIWGIGGVGKTTLLTQINNSVTMDFMFDHVLFITVSRDCTIEKIQRDIIKKLDLQVQGDPGSFIYNFLRSKNFVLLLDDVWEELDLRRVGIPHPLGFTDVATPHSISEANQRKRKVILATRFEDVCNHMGARKKIRMDCLKPEDVWQLFQKKVGETTLNSHPDIQTHATMVAEECHGLPLALVTIGRAMSSKTNPQEWEHIVRSLQRSRPPPGTEKRLFSLLKLSYDYLEDDRMRECFLCCSLWPEDFNIKKEQLIECWMGHGLIDRFDDIDEAYGIGHSIIGNLLSACLLEPAELDKELNNKFVKIHDVIRDMSLWIVGNRWLVRADVGLEVAPQEEQIWRESYKISLMNNNISSLPSRIPNCPNLTTLILRNNKFSDGRSSASFRAFRALKYLDLTYSFKDYWDNSGTFKLFLKEICSLVGLEYLNLTDSPIQVLSEEMKNLVNLKYLILRGTRVSSVSPGLLSSLAQLQVFDLYNIGSDSRNGSIVDELIFSGRQLKALGINVCTLSYLQKLTKIPTSLRSLQIDTMHGLSSLQLSAHIQSPNVLENLRELSIARSFLKEMVFDENHCLSRLESLQLWYLHCLTRIVWRNVAPGNLLPRLRRVELRNCMELKDATWVLYLPFLEILELGVCPKMKHVISDQVVDTDQEGRIVFPRLKSLSLIILRNLEAICELPVSCQVL